ncbi:MAG: hypothetical protein ACLQB1_20280, partial [Streptosporangiaceae bacterium]
GLETVAGQLGERIAVLRAEQARRQVGLAITRPAWKNLVFTGGPGAGKSRAARAVARVYAELGLLSSGTWMRWPRRAWSAPPPGRPGSWWARRSSALAGGS